ncbi:MAG: hypothetical protein P8R42_01765 [Candidatus Binatia bacterium]|nr:hypothetical protein [Candidatus Binatia bacterium]
MRFLARVSAQLFDIDRLISEAAAFTILSALLVLTVVLVVLRVLSLVGGGLGESSTAELLTSMAIAAWLVPAPGGVGGWVERFFFEERGGTVVEFNGDGMMTVFGAPEAHESKERAAVGSASDIVKGVARMRVADGASLSAGVGILTGPAFVGNIRAVA